MHRFNLCLPYDISDDEAQSLIEIKEIAVVIEESPQELRKFQLGRIKTALSLKILLPVDIRHRLAKGLESYVFCVNASFEMKDKALNLLTLILKKSWKYPQLLKTLELDWRRPFDEINQLYFNKARTYESNGNEVWNHHRKSLVQYVCKARRFFNADTATTEIWNELEPLFSNTHNVKIFKALGLLTLFLPPNSNSTELFVDTWMDLWGKVCHCSEWDQHWMSLFARCVKHNNNNMNFWQKHLRFFFARIQTALRLPAGSGRGPVNRTWPRNFAVLHTSRTNSLINSAAKLSIYLLESKNIIDAPTESATEHLLVLLSSIETFYHPSNSAAYANRLGAFLLNLSKFLCRRVGRESGMNGVQMNYEEVLNALLRICSIAIYSKSLIMTTYVLKTLGNLCSIGPKNVADKMLPSLFSALDTGTSDSPHQAPIALKAIEGILFQLLTPRAYIAPVLPTLLRLSLAGIDPNDDRKMIVTMKLYCSILDWIPLGEGSFCENQQSSGIIESFYRYKSCSDEEKRSWVEECYRASFDLQSWTLLVLDKMLFEIIRVRELPQKNGRTMEASVQTAVMYQFFHKFFQQMSPRLYVNAANITSDFLTANLLPFAGKDVSKLVAACVAGNPSVSLSLFLQPVLEKLGIFKNSGSNVAKYECRPVDLSDSELHGQLRILIGCVTDTGNTILEYKSRLVLILNAFITHKNKKARKLTCKVLKKLLKSLVTHYPLESRSMSPVHWDACISTSVQSESYSSKWGHPYTWKELQIEWYTPGQAQIEFASELLSHYLNTPIHRIMNELVNASVITSDIIEKWRFSLQQIWYSCRGVLSALPLEIETLASTSSPLIEMSYRNDLFECCHASFRYWNAQSETSRESKCMKLTMEISRAILTSAAGCVSGSKVSTLGFLYRDSKSRYCDEVTYAAAKAKYCTEYGTSSAKQGFSIGLSRASMIYRLKILQAKRMEEASYKWSQNLHFGKTGSLLLPAVKSVVEDIMFTCLNHHYDSTRDMAIRLLPHVIRHHHPLFVPNINNWCQNLSSQSISKETAYGSIAMLKQRRIAKTVFSNWKSLNEFLKHLCMSFKMVNTIENDHQEKIQKDIGRLFQNYLHQYRALEVSGNADGYIQAVDILCVSQEEMEILHWRYRFLRIACVLPLIRSGVEPPVKIWTVVMDGLASGIDPISKLCLFALGKLLTVVKPFKDSTDYDEIKEQLMSSDFVSKSLLPSMVSNHRIAFASADGQGADSSPVMWSFGVGDVLRNCSLNYQAYPNIRHQASSKHFSVTHAQLAKGLAQFCGNEAVSLVVLPVLANDLAVCNNEERRASLCTVSEVLGGIVRHVSKHTNNGDEIVLLFQQILPKISIEWSSDWVACLRFASYGRNPSGDSTILKTIADWILVQLKTSLQSSADEYATQAKWMKLLAGMLAEFSGHPTSFEFAHDVCKQLQPILKDSIGHPYKVCREAVAILLYMILLYARTGTDKTEVLSDMFSTNYSTHGVVLGECFSEENKTEYIVNQHARETAIYLLVVCIEAGDIDLYDVIISILAPVTFHFQSHPDLELAALAKFGNEMLSQRVRYLTCNNSTTAIPQERLLSFIRSIQGFSKSSSWRTRCAYIRFCTAFLAHHRMLLPQNIREEILETFIKMLSDSRSDVQALASKALTGCMVQESFNVHEKFSQRCLALGRKVATHKKVLKKLGRKKQESAEDLEEETKRCRQVLREAETVTLYSISAMIAAFPYSIPPFLPALLEELTLHISGSLAQVVRESISDFKRTHYDNWEHDKALFTSDQLSSLSDLLVSPHYFA